MFTFDLPTAEVSTASFTSEGEIRFDPPVYEQRYATVIQVLEHPDFESQLKKVVDFGCAEMRLLWLLRRTKGIEHIMESTKTRMESNGEPYTFDLNLDFLDSTTTNTKNSIITPIYQAQSQIQSTYDIESLANRIATVNDMTIQLKATKDENSKLHKEMQDFSESAMSIQSMYEQEKTERLKFTKLYGELKEKFDQIESQLTNKTLHFEQIQSRLELEAGDKKPIPYNDLALRYQRLAMLLEEEKQLPSKDKLSLQQIKDYLENKKLSPLPMCKKKSHSKVKSRDFSIQCNFKAESQSQETQCSFGNNCEEEPKDTCTQGTQYTWYTTTRGTNTPALTNSKTELKTQGTQYISSTTTRGTSTSTFIKTQSVGTNFPEPVPPVSIEDIFKEMIFDVSPLSPMAATPPQAEFKEEKVEMKSIGTCTGLKNVRKPIDYVAANIKNSDSRPPSRNNSLYDRVKNEIPLMGMPTLNPFAGLGIQAAPMHNTVAELWNMLGHTIFALLQQNNGAAPVPLNSMNMNVVNDRMRNLSGRNNRAPSEPQQRNCEAQTNTDYYEQEYPREYSTATRSAATSPILPSGLQTNQQTHTRPSFVPVTRSPSQPVEIQKIILNKNFTEPVVSSSKKSSQVDEILQLFPEYFDSFKKRKAIKRLLKETTKNKKSKKERNSSSSSSWESTSSQSQITHVKTRPTSPELAVLTQPQHVMETPQIKPDPQTTTTNWKTEMFGDSYSDSSLDSTTMEYITTHSPQETPELKLTPHEMKPPPNESNFPLTNKSTLEINRTQFKLPIEDDEFLGFDEETSPPPSSNENFCKPFVQPNRVESVKVSDPSVRKIQENFNVNPNFCGENSFKSEPQIATKQPNPKRKRRTKKEIAEQVNKIYKLDESSSMLPESETCTTETKKPKKSLSLNKTKAKINNIVLPLESTSTSASCANNKPKRSLSLKRVKNSKQQPPMFVPSNQTVPEPKKSPVYIKPDWMNRVQNLEEKDLSIQVSRHHHGPMVMKVENPPDSVFQDIKTCFSNQRADSVFQDIKTCFTTNARDDKPIMSPIISPNQPQTQNSDIPSPEPSPISIVAPKEDATYRFLIQKQERDVKPFIGPTISPNQAQTQSEDVVFPSEQSSLPFVAAKENATYRFLLQNQHTTSNINASSIDSITNPSNSLKVINYYEPPSQPQEQENPPETKSNSSITILNEQWLSEKNDLKETKQESRRTLNILSPLDQSTFDLENIPICFLDDQNNILPTQEQPKEEIKTFVETNQGVSYTNSQHVTTLPGFQEIQQGIKTGAFQFIPSPNNSLPKQDLQVSRPDGFQLNRFPVIVQDKPSFLQNHMTTTTNTTESSPTTPTRDVKPLITTPSSYLVLSHQKQLLNSCSEPLTTTCTRMEEDLQVLPTNRGNDLPAASNHLNVQSISPETQENGETTLMFSLQNQNFFGSKQLGHTKSNEDLSRYAEENESPLTVRQLPNASILNNVPEQKMLINSSDSLVPNQTPFKTPMSSATSIKKDCTDSDGSSDSEGDLSIDFPPSPPQPVNNSALDLSKILKTPEKEEEQEVNSLVDDEVQFKTPASCCPKNNSLLNKVITNSTEKLVEDFIFNENNPGAKFQVFLDRILDDVAPPSSPVSSIALSEKPSHSDAESSCDEISSPEATTTTKTPIKYKRKAAPTAALAIKRSARIKAKSIEAKTMVHRLSAMTTTIPNVELGKYTKKKTEENLIEQKQIVEPVVKEEKINIQMGFFQEAMDQHDDDDDDEEPTCEPIRRHSVEECKAAKENIAKDVPGRRKQMQNRINYFTEDHNLPAYSPVEEVDSYLSLCKKTKESISLYIKSEDSSTLPKSPPSPPAIDNYSSSKSFDESSSFYDESPASPPPLDCRPNETHTIRESFEQTPSLTEDRSVNSNCKTIISHLINNYNHKQHMMLTRAQHCDGQLLDELYDCIKEFLSGPCLMMDTVRFVDSIFKLTSDDKTIAKAIVSVAKVAPRPEIEVTAKVPDTYLSQTHRKLLAVVETLGQHFPNLHRHLQSTIEQSLFTFVKEVIPMEVLMNLTQFYLAIIAIPPMPGTNPARLFICKCLYFYNKKAIPMIYHTLCVYPTVLPQRIDSTYDRSDILISTIQSILMSTYYDPEKCDFMTRQILAKLRMFYNYESFKPPRDEVIENMMAKIRAGRFKNVSYALSLICKRMEQNQTEKFILNQRLLPLANEFYHTLSQTSENDEKIACVLECISFVIRPFTFDTDISQYVNLFERFLNATNAERKVIQEAAVAAILRTARFGFVQCFNAIYNFTPTYELSETLKLMLRSFIYKKGKVFLQALERQAQELVAK